VNLLLNCRSCRTNFDSIQGADDHEMTNDETCFLAQYTIVRDAE